MNDLEAFVSRRLEEKSLPPEFQRAYERLFVLSGRLRTAGKTEGWLDVATGLAPALKFGEYLFGVDAASSANRSSDSISAIMATAWNTPGLPPLVGRAGAHAGPLIRRRPTG